MGDLKSMPTIPNGNKCGIVFLELTSNIGVKNKRLQFKICNSEVTEGQIPSYVFLAKTSLISCFGAAREFRIIFF